MPSIKTYLRTLNLFRPPPGAELQDDHQRRNNLFATRIYLVSLFVILLGLILATSLSPQIVSVTISNPSLAQYQTLPNPTCSCSHSSLLYNQFISSDPVFHQVCSSQFISLEWISAFYFGINTTYFLPIDFRASAVGQWQALSGLCQLSQAYVLQSLSVFGSTSFISSQVISETVLEAQGRAFSEQFQEQTPETIRTQVQLINDMIMGDQLLNGLETSIFPILVAGNIGFRVGLNLNGFQQEDDSWCWCVESLSCRGPSGFYKEFNFETDGFLWNNFTAIVKVPGFASGCMPVDALLQSTLECFYNQTCVNAVVSFSNKPRRIFPAMNIQSTSTFKTTSSVQSILNQLLVDDWGIDVSFAKYYAACAPLSCTYSANQRHSFTYVLTTLIGLLGGLCARLGFIVPLVVNFIRSRPSTQPQPKLSLLGRLREVKRMLKQLLVGLNLFETHPSDQRQVRRQRIATRLYIILVLVILIILVLYSSITVEVYQETVQNPSQAQFTYLQSQYSTSLNCPCSSISNAYDIFLDVTPRYNQVCSSAFVTADWLLYLNGGLLTNAIYYYLDYRGDAIAHFELLVTFYQRSQQTIINSLQLFLQQHYVSAQVIPEELFLSQAAAFIQDWQIALVKDFNRTLQLIQANRQGNQYMAGSYDGKLILNSTNQVTPQSRAYISDDGQSTCDCAISASCRKQMGIYSFDTYTYNATIIYSVPNFYIGCYPVQALFESTLECYYNRSCMDTIASYLPNSNASTTFPTLNASLSQPNEPIGSIVGRLYVDEWVPNISFSSYYHACSPMSCTYEYTRRRDILSLVTIIIGVIGGLTTSLKILLFILLRLANKIRTDQPISTHLRSIKDWFRTLNNERYLANRLKVVLLVTILVVLYLITSLSLQLKTVQVSKPSLATYKDLLMKYPTTLQCPCSHVSIAYGSFINLSTATYHQVCASDFVTERWFKAMYGNGASSRFAPVDYQFIAVGQFRFLASLCQLTQQSFNDALSSLNNSAFIDLYLISPVLFNEQIQSIVVQFQTDTPDSFITTLQLVRNLAATNTLMNLYESSWQWINMSQSLSNFATIHTQPVTYGSCDCGLSSQCVQPAVTPNQQSLPGLLVGCYPIESFLQSTLQCLYNASCIRQLHSTNLSFTPLNASVSSRYGQNSTMTTIISQLMVEQWSSNVIYEMYFTECTPIYCSYSYFEHRPAIDVLTTLLGLYGGLVIIMKVIVPVLINIWHAITRRNQQVIPVMIK